MLYLLRISPGCPFSSHVSAAAPSSGPMAPWTKTTAPSESATALPKGSGAGVLPDPAAVCSTAAEGGIVAAWQAAFFCLIGKTGVCLPSSSSHAQRRLLPSFFQNARSHGVDACNLHAGALRWTLTPCQATRCASSTGSTTSCTPTCTRMA